MRWFEEWILQRARRINNRPQADSTMTAGRNQIMRENSIGDRQHRMNFAVYRANGGTVVEINRYDRKKDDNYCDLHIVHSDENLGEALSKIITFESLKS
jgi:hypothetical protein